MELKPYVPSGAWMHFLLSVTLDNSRTSCFPLWGLARKRFLGLLILLLFLLNRSLLWACRWSLRALLRLNRRSSSWLLRSDLSSSNGSLLCHSNWSFLWSGSSSLLCGGFSSASSLVCRGFRSVCTLLGRGFSSSCSLLCSSFSCRCSLSAAVSAATALFSAAAAAAVCSLTSFSRAFTLDCWGNSRRTEPVRKG